MKKFKPFFAVFLALSIVILSGCSGIQAMFSQNSSDLYEITAISKTATRCRSIDILDDTVLFLSSKSIDPYELTLYNVQENKIIAQKSLADFPLENITEAKFNGNDQIIVYDEHSEKAVTYDLNLNQTGEIDYVAPVWSYDDVPKSDLIEVYFASTENYAYYSDNSNFYFLSFNEPDKAFVFKNYDQHIITEHDGLLLVQNDTYSEESDSFTSTISAIDYENGLCVNEISFDAKGRNCYLDIQNFAVNDKYICFNKRIINDETNGVEETPYLWKYTENPGNKTVDVKMMTVDDFGDENAVIIKDIKEKYGIGIKVNEPAEYPQFEAEYNAASISVYSILNSLSEVFEFFPDNFIKEIYQDQENNKRFSIYIVSDIIGAGGYATDLPDYYQIVYATMSFDKGVAVHELMHLIDNRIMDYYEANNSDFYELWCSLNPDDFDYLNNPYFDEEYFISDYATTSIDEDMADMFKFMYYAYENGDSNWFNEYEHVNKKAVLLCEAIRKAFPSMANAEEVFWEKHIDFEK